VPSVASKAKQRFQKTGLAKNSKNQNIDDERPGGRARKKKKDLETRKRATHVNKEGIQPPEFLEKRGEGNGVKSKKKHHHQEGPPWGNSRVVEGKG